ncbi:hypothetical protein Pint_01716 [Pistacia integerrima]|uniref:Uncharacterized protein n=1 Tax=Pistacia integerrima TaxID=434235 RepID=A0ACC0ZFR9_9ROSI|nr:hypothetical protein Pint_01716 [Pistacia integerrima]
MNSYKALGRISFSIFLANLRN